MVINGDNNNVGGNSQRIMIQGTDNDVRGNSSGCVLLNSSGCTLLGVNSNVSLNNCIGVTVARGVSDVNAFSVENITITQSGVYFGRGVVAPAVGVSLTIDLDDPVNYTGKVLTIPAGNSYTSDITLISTTASIEIENIVNPPDVLFKLIKGGSITSLRITASVNILVPDPATYALLDGTANDYIVFEKVSSTLIKQVEVNVY